MGQIGGGQEFVFKLFLIVSIGENRQTLDPLWSPAALVFALTGLGLERCKLLDISTPAYRDSETLRALQMHRLSRRLFARIA